MSEEIKTLDLTKPVRFCRCSDIIRAIFPSTRPGKYLVEYECENGAVTAITVEAYEVENIPEPKPLTWAQAMQAMADGKKVRNVKWFEGIYISATDWNLNVYKVNWEELVHAEWEILEENQ